MRVFCHCQVSLKEAEGGPGCSHAPEDKLSSLLCSLCLSPGCPRPCADTPGPQPQPMDLRVGQRPPVEPPPEPTLLALQRPQRLHHHLFLAGLQQQRSVEPMRVKMELPARGATLSLVPSLPAFSLPRPQSQSSTSCSFLGCRPCPQLSMDTPMPELQVGPQEQELRQLLHKDKSKRSKEDTAPAQPSPTSRVPVAACVACEG